MSTTTREAIPEEINDDPVSATHRLEYTFNPESPRILVVDDERVIREILSDFLGLEGYVVRTVEDGVQALEELQKRSYNLVISDLKMPKMNGLDLIEKITELGIPVLTVIMTGFGTVETAIEAMKHGAYDYILKPFKVEEVIHIVKRGLDRQRLQHENLRLKDALSIYKISEAIATSLSVEKVLDLVLDAVLDAVDADIVNLLLEQPGDASDADDRPGTFVEHARKVSPRLERSETAPPLNFGEVLPLLQEDKPLLAHSARAYRFLSGPPEKRLVSFCSIPLKLKGRIIGMLNAYSYTKGAKFSEGQRKMLYVLGSRAAVSIENARLYESLVDTNEDLIHANVSLEENFKQTIIGFAHALEESDRYTRGHSERVATYARLIAVGMRLPERRDRDRGQVGPAARRGQDRHPQRPPEQARQADPGRAGHVPLAPGQGQAHPRAHPLHARHRARLLLPPRGLGRLGLPAGPVRPTRSPSSAASSPSPTPTTP